MIICFASTYICKVMSKLYFSQNFVLQNLRIYNIHNLVEKVLLAK